MAASCLFCLVPVLISSFFHKHSEAIFSGESSHTLPTFKTSLDICKGITEHSGPERRAAADKACEQAFKALDGVKLNSCRGWRHAECSFTAGDRHPQCTCMISNCNSISVTTNVVKTFRDCAPAHWTLGQAMGQTAAPTANFQQHRSNSVGVGQVAPFRSTSSYPGHQRGIGSSTVLNGSGGASSSKSVYTSSGPGIPSNTYNSGLAHPSETYPSYAPGALDMTWLDMIGGQTAEQTKAASKFSHQCDECNGKFRSARALFNHKRVRHTVSDLHCYMCNYTYNYRKTFLAHLRKRHPDIAAEETVLNNFSGDPAITKEVLPYSCTGCSKRFSSRPGLRDHMKSHTSDDTKCRDCDRTFSNRGNFKYHMRTAHPGTPIPAPEPRSKAYTISKPATGPFACGECGRSYAHRKGLRDHEKSHTSLETYCIVCDLTFSATQSYKTHMQSEHPEIAAAEAAAARERYEISHPEKCEICNKRFKNAYGLRDHKASHDGTSTCDICNTVLPRKSAISTHKRKEHPK